VGLKKLLISLAIILLLLALALPLALKLFFPEEKLRAMALPRAEAALQRSIDLEGISLGFGLEGLRLKMRGLSLGPDSLGTGLLKLDLPRLDARLAWGPLLHRELAIRSLRIEGASVELAPVPEAPGEQEVTTTTQATGTRSLAFAVAAPDVQLHDSRLRLHLPDSPEPLTLDLPLMRFASQLGAEGRLNLDGRIELDGLTGGLPSALDHQGRLRLEFELATPLSAFEGQLDPTLLELKAKLLAEEILLRQTDPQPLSLELPRLEMDLSADGGALALAVSPLELRSSSLPGPLELKACRLTGRTDTGDLTLETLRLIRGESSLEANGRVRGLPATPAMELKLRSSLLDLADFLIPIPESTGPDQGEAAPQAPAPLLPPLPEGVIDFVVEHLRHPRAELSDLRGQILVGTHGLKLEKLTGDLYGGELSGRLDLSPDETDPTDLDLHGEFAVTGSQAPAFLAAFTPIDRGVTGTIGTQLAIDFKLRPGEQPREMDLDADLDLQDGALEGLPYLKALARAAGLPEKERYAVGRVKQNVKVREDRVITRDLRLPFEDGWVELGGSAGLAGDLDFDGRWEPGPATLAKLGQGDLKKWLADAEGKVILDFHLGGTARHPMVTLDTSSLQKRLVKKAEEKLKEEGEELLQQGLDALRKRFK
jgi:hypothetical protein